MHDTDPTAPTAPTAAEPSVPLPLPVAERESWRTLLPSLLRIGANTFGGPVAQIGAMHEEAVGRRAWVNDGQFVHLVDFANVLPGPEALEVAIHLGWIRRGVAGGIVAGLLFIAPGFIALTALAWIYVRFGEVPLLAAAFSGVRCAAIALIAAAAMRLASRALTRPTALALALAVFLVTLLLDAPFLPTLAVCAGIGALVDLRERQVSARWRGGVALAVAAAIVAGTLASPRSPAAEPAGLPAAATGKRAAATASEIAVVNLKAALVTFGGAYTVLPYLREQMAERRRWVTDREVADALALGETTPGPLICVGVFLSYLAGGFAGAAAGAVALFLPSFVFVLGLARWVARIERLPRAREALRGVSAATIGLVLAMSVRLAPASLPDAFSVAVAAAGFAALWRWRAHPLLVVAASAAVGMAR